MNFYLNVSKILSFLLFLTVVVHCKDKSQSELETKSKQGAGNQMDVKVSIVEIPMTEVVRSITFYEKVFQIKIERMTMEDTELGVFPSNGNGANIVLTKGKDYKPKSEGVLVYLDGGDDLQPILSLVSLNGGKVLLPKTEISPEMGYFAIFLDTEGNRIGLHSKN
ncbi:VOC family protein [Leptospira bouyouniensis]|nr:VOC family protein [Leptospira bouyouniensis]